MNTLFKKIFLKGCNKKELKPKKDNIIRRALLIGCNYTGTSSQLEGCVNDIKNIKNYLINHANYEETDIVMLSDQRGELKSNLPTKANIESAIEKFVSDLPEKERVILFFHYSGHGSYTADVNSDEDDGTDETIVPLDYEENGFIIDDELKTMLVDNLGSNVELYCIMDCCHSGTGLDLRYSCKVKSKLDSKEYYFVHNKKTLKSAAKVILFSGCKDNQTSADSKIGLKHQGAMTWAFLEVLSKNNYQAISYKTILHSLLDLLAKNEYTQVPQLSSGTFIDLKSTFNLL